MAAILRDPPASTDGDLDVVPGFGQLVHRMLAKACVECLQTMGDVRGALDARRDLPASGSRRGPPHDRQARLTIGAGPAAEADAVPARHDSPESCNAWSMSAAAARSPVSVTSRKALTARLINPTS
jgi:hypothetical protein